MNTLVRKRKLVGVLAVALAVLTGVVLWIPKEEDRIEMTETTEVVEVTEVPKAGVAIGEPGVDDDEIATETEVDGAMGDTADDGIEGEIAPEPTVETPKLPSFSVWRGFLKGFSYNFIEVENATPYVYMPSDRGDFESDVNNVTAGKEGGNIIVMANAGIFSDNTEPLGSVIQNGKLVSEHEAEGSWCWTLVVDEDGNVGYVNSPVNDTTVDYIDARTGEVMTGKKIVSAVYAFVPFMMNGRAVEEFRSSYEGAYRARQIFCVKQNSYMIITNTGEGKDGGGWEFNDMVQVATYRGCLSAFNLDGGGSTATAYRISLNNNFTISATTKRHDPTFIVFTADNLAPSGK